MFFRIDAEISFFDLLWTIMRYSLVEGPASANELSKCLILIAEGLEQCYGFLVNLF